MNTNKKISKLRELMKEENMDAYLVGDFDKHGSEYANNYYKERSFMSGFLGSDGTLLVTEDKAYLWTDGRYFLQAEIELEGSSISLMKMGTEGYPSLIEYIKNSLNGKTIGLNGEYFSTIFVDTIKPFVNVKADKDLVNLIWQDRGELEFSDIWAVDKKLTGETIQSKIERIRAKLKEHNCSSNVVADITDIAWIFNLRGNDISITPVFFSFAYISLDKTVLFVNKSSLNSASVSSLKQAKVEVKEYNEFLGFLKELKGEKVLVNASSLNYLYVSTLKENNEVVYGVNPSQLMKAIKNEVEIKNNNLVHIIDGAAIFRFMKYIKENYNKIPLDEYSLAEVVLNYRKMNDKFFEVSFDSIASWNENGAIIHYEPTKESSKKVVGTGFFLLDSGGQYYGGTTDTTRTYQLGDITDEMKHHYTMVLKSNIDVSMASFMKGASGQNLDMLARLPFWMEGMDYKHGTGHGVGYMNNVHEAPNGIRWQKVAERSDQATFTPGMIQSIEPGIYLKDKYGIRIENEIMVQEKEVTDYGTFYDFKTITCTPIDTEPILLNELTKEEKKWLNDYHKWVYKSLKKYLNEEEVEYLKKVTKKI